MKPAPTTRRAGMTLIELLVVITIIGLLSVAVLPSLNRKSDGKRLLTAAEIVSSHLNQQVSRALGSANGSATWYAAESIGAGSGLAVVSLQAGRPQVTISGSAWISVSGSVAPSFPSGVAALLPAPIQFAGIPAEFTATMTPPNHVVVADSTMNRNSWNLSLPLATGDPLPYVLSLPPRQRLQVSAPALQNNTCIDLSQNPAARWVVLDPRSSTVRIVENSASSTIPGAQAYVLQTLRGL